MFVVTILRVLRKASVAFSADQLAIEYTLFNFSQSQPFVFLYLPKIEVFVRNKTAMVVEIFCFERLSCEGLFI